MEIRLLCPSSWLALLLLLGVLSCITKTHAAFCDHPDFDTGFFAVDSNNDADVYFDVSHTLPAHPSRVVVQFREEATGHTFEGQGSAFRGEEIRLRTGGSGVVYGFDDSVVRIWLQKIPERPGGFVVAVGDGYGSDLWAVRPTREIQLRVQAWADLPAYSELFESDWVPMNSAEPFVELDHGLSTRPTLLLAYTRPSGSTMYHPATGSAGVSARPDLKAGFLLTGYDDSRIRAWRHNTYPLVSTAGGWGLNQEIIESDGDVKFIALVETNPGIPLGPFPMQSLGTASQVEVTAPHNQPDLPSSVIVTARVTQTDSSNFGFSFAAIGSQPLDDDFTDLYGGMIYSYTDSDIHVYAPSFFNNQRGGRAILLSSFGNGIHATDVTEVETSAYVCYVPSVTSSPSLTATRTPTPSISESVTRTPTPSASATPSPSATRTVTPTPTRSSTATPTPTRSRTTTPTPSATASRTPSPSSTHTPSHTPSSSATPTPSPSPAAVIASLSSNQVLEGHSVDLTIMLIRPPVDLVVVTISPDAPVESDPTSVTFFPETWSFGENRTTTLTAVDLTVPPGATVDSTINLVVSSGDPAYDGLSPNPPLLRVRDNGAIVEILGDSDRSFTTQDRITFSTNIRRAGGAPVSADDATYLWAVGAIQRDPALAGEDFTPSPVVMEQGTSPLFTIVGNDYEAGSMFEVVVTITTGNDVVSSEPVLIHVTPIEPSSDSLVVSLVPFFALANSHVTQGDFNNFTLSSTLDDLDNLDFIPETYSWACEKLANTIDDVLDVVGAASSPAGTPATLTYDPPPPCEWFPADLDTPSIFAEAPPVGFYRVTATFGKGTPGVSLIPLRYRQTSLSILYSVEPGLRPEPAITQFAPRVNPRSKPVLSGGDQTPIGSNITYMWSIVEEAIPDGVALEGSVFLTTPTLPTVTLFPGALEPGFEYLFRLTATDISGLSTSVDVSVVVNQPPIGGVIDGFPRSGIALDTFFSFDARDWTDTEDLPLSYTWAFNTAPLGLNNTNPDKDFRLTPKPLAYANQTDFRLPVSANADNMVAITLLVFDNKGAYSRAEPFGIHVVLPAIDTNQTAADFIGGKSDELLSVLDNPDMELSEEGAGEVLRNAVVLSLVLTGADAAIDICTTMDCGGPTRGVCFSGKCRCAPGLAGDHCQFGTPNPLALDTCTINGIVNADDCLPPARRCPGSTEQLLSLSAPDPTLRIPLIQCSGHGQCMREPVDCRDTGGGCLAACLCDEGWDREDCALTTTQMTEFRELQKRFVGAQNATLGASDLGSETSLTQQSSALSAITLNPNRLDENATLGALDVAGNLIGAAVNQSGALDMAPALDLLGVLDGVNSESSNRVVGQCESVLEVVEEDGRRRRLSRTAGSVTVVRGHKVRRRRVKRRRRMVEDETAARGLRGVRMLQMEDEDCELGHAATVSSTVVGGVGGVASGLMGDAKLGEPPVAIATDTLAMNLTRSSLDDLPSHSGVDFPQGVASGLADLRDGVAPQVDIRAITWNTNPYSFAPDSQALSTGVVTVELAQTDGVVLAVADAVVPLTFQMEVPETTVLADYQCAFYNADTMSWVSRGMAVVGFTSGSGGERKVICASIHLTDFSGGEEEQLPDILFINPIGDAGAITKILDPSNLMTTIVVFVTLMFFLLSWCWSLRVEKDHQESLDALRRTQFLEFGEIRSGLGMDTLHHSALHGDVASTSRQEIRKEKRLGTVFLAFRHVMRMYKDNMLREHTIAAVAFPTHDERLIVTRPQRLASMCAAFLTAMAVSALLFGLSPSSVEGLILVAVLSALLMLPVEWFFPAMFEAANTMSSHTLERLANIRTKIFVRRQKEADMEAAEKEAIAAESKARQAVVDAEIRKEQIIMKLRNGGGTPGLKVKKTTRGGGAGAESKSQPAGGGFASGSRAGRPSPIITRPSGSSPSAGSSSPPRAPPRTGPSRNGTPIAFANPAVQTPSSITPYVSTPVHAFVGGAGGLESPADRAVDAVFSSASSGSSAFSPNVGGSSRPISGSRKSRRAKASSPLVAQAMMNAANRVASASPSPSSSSVSSSNQSTPIRSGWLAGGDKTEDVRGVERAPNSLNFGEDDAAQRLAVSGASRRAGDASASSSSLRLSDSTRLIPTDSHLNSHVAFRTIFALMSAVMIWTSSCAAGYAVFNLASGSTSYETYGVTAGGAVLCFAFALTAFLFARVRKLTGTAVFFLLSVAVQVLVVLKLHLDQLENRIQVFYIVGALQALMAIVLFVGGWFVYRNNLRIEAEEELERQEAAQVSALWEKESMEAGPDYLVYRLKVVMKLQALYRLTRLRRTVEREREYAAWKSLWRERRLLTRLVYLGLLITVLFLTFINLLYGVKFSKEQQRGWLIGVFSGLFLDIVVMNPIIILGKTVYAFMRAASAEGLDNVVHEHVKAHALTYARPWKATFIKKDVDLEQYETELTRSHST